jgi:endoglucanase
MNELLKQLTETVGVTNDEKSIRIIIRDLIDDHVDEWRVDTLGNLIATKKGTGESDLRFMVDAHMDEVGLMVIGYDSDGSIKFQTMGGFDDRALLGKVVQVGTKNLVGAIGARPVHLLKRSQYNNLVKTEAMRIDIGAKSKEEAQRKAKIGDMATFVTDYEELGEMAIGKAFDNRAGCAVLIELLKGEPYPFDLVAAFTVQEEVGTRGAKVAAFAVKPDAALILECTPAYDLPNKRDVSPNVMLGKGPSIYVMDARTIQDPRLVSHITRTATEQNIPFQIRRPGGGGTNTAAIQQSGIGVPAATIATPARYIHGPTSMINLKDYKNVIALADVSMRSFSREVLKR